MTYTGCQIRLPRDNQGKHWPISSENAEPPYAELQSKPTFKYPGQGQFCFGLAAVRLSDGTVIGRKSKVFDYTVLLVRVDHFQFFYKSY